MYSIGKYYQKECAKLTEERIDILLNPHLYIIGYYAEFQINLFYPLLSLSNFVSVITHVLQG